MKWTFYIDGWEVYPTNFFRQRWTPEEIQKMADGEVITKGGKEYYIELED